MATDRVVDIRNYWASVVKNTEEFQQIAIAENPEFNALAACLKRALDDSFIQTATEYGVERWENLLNITPLDTDTLDDRKTRILTQLSIQKPYTWRVLKQIMTTIVVEGNYDMSYVNDTFTLNVELLDPTKHKEIAELLDKVLPQNIVVSLLVQKYMKCVTVDDVKAVNADYATDLTADGAWNYKLHALTDGGLMFYKNTMLMSFNVSLPALKIGGISNGIGMFCGCTGLKNWDILLPALTNGTSMFYGCTGLKSWDIPLPALTNGFCMFQNCNGFTEFHISLPSLKHGRGMFFACTKLTRFTSYLSALTFGYDMFNKCTALQSFSSALTSLTNGEHMFYTCKLDLASVQNIAATINDLAAKSKTGIITIGMQTNIKGMDKVSTALATIRAKGWTVTEQYNGYVTETPVGLTDDEPIWCKLIESEYGEYIKDGVRYIIDYGHHIQDPDGRCNAELGYTEFDSVADAAVAWGLTYINED